MNLCDHCDDAVLSMAEKNKSVGDICCQHCPGHTSALESIALDRSTGRRHVEIRCVSKAGSYEKQKHAQICKRREKEGKGKKEKKVGYVSPCIRIEREEERSFNVPPTVQANLPCWTQPDRQNRRANKTNVHKVGEADDRLSSEHQPNMQIAKLCPARRSGAGFQTD